MILQSITVLQVVWLLQEGTPLHAVARFAVSGGDIRRWAATGGELDRAIQDRLLRCNFKRTFQRPGRALQSHNNGFQKVTRACFSRHHQNQIPRGWHEAPAPVLRVQHLCSTSIHLRSPKLLPCSTCSPCEMVWETLYYL